MNGIQNTEVLTANLDDEIGIEASGSWDAIADQAGNRPTLAGYVQHDDRIVLEFTNGRELTVRQWQNQPAGQPFDGDLWDVTPLGWS
ncbi:hypothetical protein FDI29_gp33 [Arthrobacter phage Abidatro]|uniref:Uncharacterized protein n=1 Tax=Arthrobacter phage Abidatro TaxID=2015853 RepID=A0A222ZER7_9CAUD|nr:hypothetical protein FDI29_gp33 [Arthrobacter phage Abidatro]ASR83203.1 hypothetical protein SEA_ABIDATRO_33 [Arthrobacter phage Abidatro]